jgi:transcriptional regulator with XRE-family HTH domain
MPRYPIEALGPLLRQRRRALRRSLRDLADEIDVSFNTLSRVERGHVPDLNNFRKIVAWLGLPIDAFSIVDDDRVEALDTPAVIATHLMADPNLGPDDAAHLAKTLETMYRSIVGQRQAVVAAHLRAARTFTPAAAASIARVLADIHAALLRET